jgi:hypothetical protein
VHTPQPGNSDHRPRPAPPALLATVSDAGEADRAIAEGADLIDASALRAGTAAAVRARHCDARLWTGSPGAVDVDTIAMAAGDAAAGDAAAGDAAADVSGTGDSLAAIVAAAAISTWLGTPVIRTRHVQPARRAIDMTLSIAGLRPPALTTRGLA